MSIKQIGSNVFRYWAILNVLQVTRMRKFSKIDKQIPCLTEKKKNYTIDSTFPYHLSERLIFTNNHRKLQITYRGEDELSICYCKRACYQRD